MYLKPMTWFSGREVGCYVWKEECEGGEIVGCGPVIVSHALRGHLVPIHGQCTSGGASRKLCSKTDSSLASHPAVRRPDFILLVHPVSSPSFMSARSSGRSAIHPYGPRLLSSLSIFCRALPYISSPPNMMMLYTRASSPTLVSYSLAYSISRNNPMLH